MIDVTKPLEKPIRQDFFDNVLNKEPISSKDRDNLFNVGSKDIEDIVSDAGLGERTIGDIGVGHDRCKEECNWWVRKGEDGENIEPFEQGDIYRKVAVAPFYLVYYAVKSLERREKKDLVKYLNTLFKVSVFTFIISIVMSINKEVVFLIPFSKLAVVMGIVAVLSRLVGVNLGDKFVEVDGDKREDIKEEVTECDNLDNSRSLGDKLDLDIEDVLDLEDDYVIGEPSERELELKRLREGYKRNFPIKENIAVKGISNDEFKDMMLRTFKKSVGKGFKSVVGREDTILSFSDYIICNNPGFAEVKNIRQGSILYNNLAYLVYDGLTRVYAELDYSGEYTMKVESLVENQIFYKLEVILPKFVKLSKVHSDIKVIESKFKAHEADNDVRVLVDAYGDKLVFKIIKESQLVISWGDVIRYYDPRPGIDYKVYEDFVDEDKYDVPILIGLQNEETPYIFDIAENTSITIAGTSGSGKSWAVFLLMFNFFIQFHPGDVSFVILDHKQSADYSTFGRFPHVVGLHHDIDAFIDLMKEVVLEQERRKKILQAFEVEKWSDLRRQLRNSPDELRRLPWLFIVVEETASVLSHLEMQSKQKEKKEEFVGLLKQIAKQGRSLGMRLIMVSQRTVDRELPKDVMSECGIKLGFKLTEGDLKRVELYHKDVVMPNGIGIAAFKDMFTTDPIIIKTLGTGGWKGPQIQSMLRMMAFDWHLRVSDEEAYGNFPEFKFVDNRLERRNKVLKDLKEGNYFGVDVKSIDVNKTLNEIDGYCQGEVSKNSTDKGNKIDSRDNLDLPKVDVSRKKVYVGNRGSKISKNIDKSNSNEVEKDIDDLIEENESMEDGLIEKRKDLLEGSCSGNKDNDEIKDDKVYGFMGSGFTGVGVGVGGNMGKSGDMGCKDDEKKNLGKQSIKEFILENGEGAHKNRIRKDILRKYYSEEEIEDALSIIEIVSSGDYYIA